MPVEPTVESSIYSQLSGDSAVTAVIGDRLFPGRIPDNEAIVPWVYYQITESLPMNTHGQLGKFIEHTVEFAILGDSYDHCRDAADAIRTSLNGYRGGQVERAIWKGESTTASDGGFLREMKFLVVAPSGAVAYTATALPRLEVRADGLYFGGVLVGAQGLQGATGSQGPQGATGPQGPQGATGPGVGGPTNLAFTDVTNAITASDQDSNSITLAGTSNQVWPILVSASAGNPRVIVNGTVYDGRLPSCQSGDILSARITAPASGSTRPVAIMVGTSRTVWNVTSSVWTPASFTTTLIWLDAGPAYCFLDLSATVNCGNGDPVAVWKDRSGNSHHFQQSTTGSRPTLRLISGIWYVEFDSVDDAMVMASAWSLTGTYSILLAEQTMDSVGSARRTISSDTTNSLMSVSRNNANNIFNTATISNALSLTVGRHTLIYSGAPSGAAKGYLDGVDSTVSTPSVANWGVLRLGAFGMGSSGAEAPATRVRALVVTSATTSVTDVGNFHTWGISA